MASETSWSRWVSWAARHCTIKLMNGEEAVIMGAQRYAGKVKIIYKNRHETIWASDVALVHEPQEFSASWVRPEPWDIEMPAWCLDKPIAKPTLVVEHNPKAVHPAFQAPIS